MKRLTVAAAALAAGMLTIVAHSQAESDRNMFHKPIAKVAAADRKTEKPDAKDIAGKGAKRIADLTKTKNLMADKARANATARANAKELGIDVQKTASKDIATKGAKRVASLAKNKSVKASKAKPRRVAIDLEKTASIGRVRPDLKAVARKSVKGLDNVSAGEGIAAGAGVASAVGYTTLVSRYASAYGVPVSLAHAVISIESNYRPDMRGSAGEIGLMQIKPATARMMGYTGNASGLFNPETNIKFGMKYLGMAHQLSGGTTCGTILRYNAGHAAHRMNPVSAAYCSKVKLRLAGGLTAG
jgi:soluble lytic murein transglycosylase-like protein